MQAPTTAILSPPQDYSACLQNTERVSEAAWAEVAEGGDRSGSSADQATMRHRSWHTVMTSWSLVQQLKMHPRQDPAYVTPTIMTDIWAREDKAATLWGFCQWDLGTGRHCSAPWLNGMLTNRPNCRAYFALAHTPLLSMNHSGHCRQISNHLSPFILLRYLCYRAAILESVWSFLKTFPEGILNASSCWATQILWYHKQIAEVAEGKYKTTLKFQINMKNTFSR